MRTGETGSYGYLASPPTTPRVCGYAPAPALEPAPPGRTDRACGCHPARRAGLRPRQVRAHRQVSLLPLLLAVGDASLGLWRRWFRNAGEDWIELDEVAARNTTAHHQGHCRPRLCHRRDLAHRIGQGRGTRGAHHVTHDLGLAEDCAQDASVASVLEVLDPMFNEDHAASAGSEWMHPALRLACVLAGPMPRQSEVLGLLARAQACDSGAHASRA